MTRPMTVSVCDRGDGRKGLVGLLLDDEGRLCLSQSHLYAEVGPSVEAIGRRPWPFQVHSETAALGPAILLSNGWAVSPAAITRLREEAVRVGWPCDLLAVE